MPRAMKSSDSPPPWPPSTTSGRSAASFFRLASTSWALIAATTTAKGLKVHAELDDRPYPAGTQIEDEELAEVRLKRDKFHGEWNYEIYPRLSASG